MIADGLTLRGIGVSFGQIAALNSIDLEISSKGVTALVGHNGSGKSTLLDIISGFLRPSQGQIAGSVQKDALHRGDLVARVARLHQRLVVPPMLSAGQFLGVVTRRPSLSTLLSPARWTNGPYQPTAAPSDFLHTVGLAGRMGTPLGKLSYGQQRALSLEAVFSTGKPIVALDEPLAGLHPTVKDSVLRRIQEEGRSRCVLIAEHELAGALLVADRVIVFRLGKIVADLPSAETTTVDLVTRL